MPTLTDTQASLLRATQLLSAAADQASETNQDVAGELMLGAVRALVWQAMVLLPEGLPLAGQQPTTPGPLGALQEAEQELRKHPIWEYPAGTSALIVALCDTIATTRAGEWL